MASEPQFRRTPTSLKRDKMTPEDFKKAAFFKVTEVPCAYWEPRMVEEDGVLIDRGQWVKNPDKKALVREDDGTYISTVGRNYSIVQNEEFFNNVVEGLNQSGILFEPKNVFIDRNGGRTNMVVTLPQFALFKGTKEHHDALLNVGNSFDTSWAANSLFGWLREWCTNGAVAFHQDFSFRMIHKGDIVEKAKAAIELYQNFESIASKEKDKYDWMASRDARPGRVAEYIGDGETTQNPILKGERWAKRLLQEWQELGEPRNAWGLYQMFTYLISHHYGHNYTAKLTAMQNLNREVEKRWQSVLKLEAKSE